MKYRMIELVVLLVLFLQNPISNGLETNQTPEPSPGPTVPGPTAPK